MTTLTQACLHTPQTVLDSIVADAPREWLEKFDDTDLLRATREELTELLSTAPNAAAAGLLVGTLMHRA